MNKKETPSQKKRAATVAAVLCFVAAIAIMGTYTLSGYKEVQQREELAKAEEAKEKQQEETDSTEETDSRVIENQKSDDTEEKAESNEEEAEKDDAASTAGTVDTAGGTAAAAGSSTNLNFGEDSQLLMPVDGTVLMSFSMDKTVYFSTLEQYKCNPAVIISAAENDQVIAGAAGIVKSIDVTAETGTTVNVDLGNGYELFYGQLKEVPLKVGDSVEANTVVGYISEPTKYYSVEGPNLYFEMRKDGQPVDPVNYL